MTTLTLLADLALAHRWHTALPRRWRQAARTENLTLDPCDFPHPTARQEQHTRLLALCPRDCLAAPSDVLRMGNPGTGTTCVATCLAYAACNANGQGRCTPAIALLNPRMAAAADHALWHTLPHDAPPARLVCDEWGSLALGPQGAPRFFQVISPRHQRTSTVMTTTVPLAAWGTVVDATTVATAIADRRGHHAAVLILGGSS